MTDGFVVKSGATTTVELTKSQHRALNRVTGYDALEILEIESEADGAIFVKVGSIHAPLLYAITPRGRVTQL